MRIEKLYGVDACYVAFHDIRLPENDPAQAIASDGGESNKKCIDHAIKVIEWGMTHDIVEGSTAEQIYEQFLQQSKIEEP